MAWMIAYGRRAQREGERIAAEQAAADAAATTPAAAEVSAASCV
jgi:hypothetical protein